MKEILVQSVEELRTALSQEGEKTILLRGGLYSVTETLHVTSHTHIQAAPGEQVRFECPLPANFQKLNRILFGESSEMRFV